MKFHRHHLALFHPDGFPVSRWDRLRAKIHNAVQLSIFVSVELSSEWKPPARFMFSHRSWDRWMNVYAVPPIHWILRLWHRIGGIWCLHRLGLRLGVLELKEEGGFYRDARLRWPRRA